MPLCGYCAASLRHPCILDYWDTLSRLIAENPAKILGFKDVGALKEEYAANVILFDPNKSKDVTKKSSPYYQTRLDGDIVKVYISKNV